MKTVLVVAYACEPHKGSEPGVGWNWVKILSKKNRVIVLTRSNNRDGIELALKKEKEMVENTQFVYYDLPKKVAFWKKGSRGLHLYYFLWQVEVLKIAKNIINKEVIDAVFSPTFGNLWRPTFLYRLPCMFIWGPLGGGEQVPLELLKQVSKKQQMFELIRRLNSKVPVSNPWFYKICSGADVIIVRTEESLQCIPVKFRSKCKLLIETGVDKEECMYYNENSILPSKSKDILIVARLVSLKFVDIGIKAFSKVSEKYPDVKLHILGDGECREKLERLVSRLRLRNSVIFYGNVERGQVFNMLTRARMLLMPSSKEGGAWVLFEAMMCGRPIICMDTSGMHVVVGEDMGIRLPVGCYDEMIEKFADAMIRLLDDGKLADKMGSLAYKRAVEEFTWDEKGRFFEELLSEKRN